MFNRIRLQKTIPGAELDPDVAAMLDAGPARGEARLVDRLAKLGGDESVATAAGIYARSVAALVDAYSDEPPAVRARVKKAIDGLFSEPAPAPLTVAKTAAPPPATRRPRPAEESLAEIEKIAKENERHWDARAEQDLEAAGERIRKASGYALTKAQSIAKAIECEPDLAAGVHRHNLRRMGVLDDRPSVIAKARQAQTALDVAARNVQATEPGLTREQAIAKALDLDPSLYEIAKAARFQVTTDTYKPIAAMSPALERAAERLMQDNPGMTKQAAVARALDENPALYQGNANDTAGDGGN